MQLYTSFVLLLITAYVIALKMIIKLLSTRSLSASLLPILITYIKPRIKKMIEYIRTDYAHRVSIQVASHISTENNEANQLDYLSGLINSSICAVTGYIESTLFLYTIMPYLLATGYCGIAAAAFLLIVKSHADSWTSGLLTDSVVSKIKSNNQSKQKTTYQQMNQLATITEPQTNNKVILSRQLLTEFLTMITDMVMFYVIVLSPTISPIIPIRSAIYIMELAKSTHTIAEHSRNISTNLTLLGKTIDITSHTPQERIERLLKRKGVTPYRIETDQLSKVNLINGQNAAGKSTLAEILMWNVIKQQPAGKAITVLQPNFKSNQQFHMSDGQHTLSQLYKLQNDIRMSIEKNQNQVLLITIDEPETGLDQQNLLQAMEILNNLSDQLRPTDRLFIVSNHFTTLAFDHHSIIATRHRQNQYWQSCRRLSAS